jgi:aspartyl-tRNA(Asn)/glutamyl-tRNA(Gln) amidotransferase subunit B
MEKGTETKYKTTIGLEVHAELKTRTKMFCDSKNDPDEERPNVNICPICMGHPGTLPVINKEAVKHVLKIGLAVGGTLADFTEFDRKNYFYPDIPKGYQISQYKYPLVTGGKLKGVALTRVHLEEDTATSQHDKGDFSLVDFNRAGLPLMELVTEPVIHSAKEASDFAKELQLLLQYTGAGDANMEKGEMRVEANISISADDTFGTKVEVKNLNSFKAVEKAIEYEVKRMTQLLEKGEKVVQETRGWDENKQATFSQRKKEDSHDYRYFPDPDLPKLKISEIEEFSKENLQKELPELPWEKRTRYGKEYGIKDEDIEMYVRSEAWGVYFEAVAKILNDSKLIASASNYITSDLVGLTKKDPDNWGVEMLNLADKMPPVNFAELITMLNANKISSRGAKDILALMYTGETASNIAIEKSLLQQSDEGALTMMLQEIINEHPSVVADFKAGKQSALQFFVGQAMKRSKGSANPGVVQNLLKNLLV